MAKTHIIAHDSEILVKGGKTLDKVLGKGDNSGDSVIIECIRNEFDKYVIKDEYILKALNAINTGKQLIGHMYSNDPDDLYVTVEALSGSVGVSKNDIGKELTTIGDYDSAFIGYMDSTGFVTIYEI